MQPECRRPCLSLVWSVRSNRVADHCLCMLESWVLPECRSPTSCLSSLCVPTELALPRICMVTLQESKWHLFFKPREWRRNGNKSRKKGSSSSGNRRKRRLVILKCNASTAFVCQASVLEYKHHYSMVSMLEFIRVSLVTKIQLYFDFDACPYYSHMSKSSRS